MNDKEERKLLKTQMSIIELAFSNELKTIDKRIQNLSHKYPGRIFSVNDIQNLKCN